MVAVGGCGAVAIYEDPKTKHKLAAKVEPAVLNPNIRSSLVEMQFLHEFSKKPSPYLPVCYGTDKFNNISIVQMEYLEYSVEEYVKLPKSQRKLKLEEVAVQMLHALKTLH